MYHHLPVEHNEDKALAVDPTAADQLALLRGMVPEHLAALREQLPRIRRDHDRNPSVLSALDDMCRALDVMGSALVRAACGIDDPDTAYRQGHR